MSFVVSSIVVVSLKKVVNNVRADEWTAEWAIIASNEYTPCRSPVNFVFFVEIDLRKLDWMVVSEKNILNHK